MLSTIPYYKWKCSGDAKEVVTKAEGGIANLKLEAVDIEDSKFFVPNQNKEYSCPFCDRAFKVT